MRIGILCALSAYHRLSSPNDHYEGCHHRYDQACYARIIVRAVDRKELPCDVEHGMENNRDEYTPTCVVVKPGDDDS